MAMTLVTGATGQTGLQIVQGLRQAQHPLRAFVRDRQKAEKLGLKPAECFVGDLREPSQVEQAMSGCTHVIIAAGATPIMEIAESGARTFRFEDGQRPEDIDYRATHHQIVAATGASIHKVVLVSSAGVTDPDHRLNQLDNSNLLKWKLKAEDELRQSGLSYGIVRPGRLLNAGPDTDRRLRVDRDDNVAGAVAREDVAAVCVQLLLDDALPSLTFNLYAESGETEADLSALLRGLQPRG